MSALPGSKTRPAAPRSRWARGLARAIAPVSSLMSVLGTAWIFALMLLISADVLGRQVFNHPLPGVPEIIAQSIVGIVFLQLVETQRKGRLIRSDLFLSRMLQDRPWLGRGLLSFHNLMGAALMAVTCGFTWPKLLRAWQEGEYVGTLGTFTFPLWPLTLIVVITTAVAALSFLLFALFPRYAQDIEFVEAQNG